MPTTTIWTSAGAIKVSIPPDATIADLKHLLARHLFYDEERLQISYGGRYVRDDVLVARFPPETLVAEGPRFSRAEVARRMQQEAEAERQREYLAYLKQQAEEQERRMMLKRRQEAEEAEQRRLRHQRAQMEALQRRRQQQQEEEEEEEEEEEHDDAHGNTYYDPFSFGPFGLFGAPRPRSRPTARQRQQAFQAQQRAQRELLAEQQQQQQRVKAEREAARKQQQLEEQQRQRKEKARLEREEALRQMEANRKRLQEQQEAIRKQQELLAAQERELLRRIEEEARLLKESEAAEEEEEAQKKKKKKAEEEKKKAAEKKKEDSATKKKEDSETKKKEDSETKAEKKKKEEPVATPQQSTTKKEGEGTPQASDSKTASHRPSLTIVPPKPVDADDALSPSNAAAVADSVARNASSTGCDFAPFTREASAVIVTPHLNRVGLDENIHLPVDEQPSPATTPRSTEEGEVEDDEDDAVNDTNADDEEDDDDAVYEPSSNEAYAPASPAPEISIKAYFAELSKLVTIKVPQDCLVSDLLAAVKASEPEATKDGVRIMFYEKYVKNEKERIRSVPLVDGSAIDVCTGKFLSENEMTLFLANRKLQEVRAAVSDSVGSLAPNVRQHWNEELMKALSLLDSLQDVPDDVRMRRRAAVKEVMAEQDIILGMH